MTTATRQTDRRPSAAPGLRQEDYTSNTLNQYSQRTVPGTVGILGYTDPGRV